MVLGTSARERGARCDLISEATPGVAYVAEEETAELLRGRAFRVTDRDITYLTTHSAPPPPAAMSGDGIAAAAPAEAPRTTGPGTGKAGADIDVRHGTP
jgi:S-DNA-T family DNA segregation ATPase FtsK/SpoIIIE